MSLVKHSFLSDVISADLYEDIIVYAKPIVKIGTIVVAVAFLLSRLVHWQFVSWLLNLSSGASIPFTVYIAAWILLLDKRIEEDTGNYKYFSGRKPKKSSAYKATIVWGAMLVLMGIVIVYFTNQYRHHYAYQCETFLVDKEKGVYHIPTFYKKCVIERMDASLYEDTEFVPDNVVKMKGYEIEECTNCILCETCNEWAEDAEDEYRFSQFDKK